LVSFEVDLRSDLRDAIKATTEMSNARPLTATVSACKNTCTLVALVGDAHPSSSLPR